MGKETQKPMKEKHRCEKWISYSICIDKIYNFLYNEKLKYYRFSLFHRFP